MHRQLLMMKKLHANAGQTMAEYVVVLGVISIATVGAFGLFAGRIAELIDAVRDAFGL
jgi:Flp pilus assembly pilin Flp